MSYAFTISCSVMFVICTAAAIFATLSYKATIQSSPDCDTECQVMLSRVYFGEQILLNQKDYRYIDLQTFQPSFFSERTGSKIKLNDVFWIDDSVK